MRLVATALPDVSVVEAPLFQDERGFFLEVFHADKFETLGLPTNFVQDNHSRSVRATLRGLHYQMVQPQGKLVRAVTGTIYDVAVDIRRRSPTFGKWCGVTLSAGDGRQLWIPPGFAHGFLVLSETADVSYKCTTVYHPQSDRSLAWNDGDVGIEWPLASGQLPQLSQKDAAAPGLAVAELFD